MKIKVIDITADSNIKVKTAIGTVIIKSNEYIELKKNEIGFLEGKRKHHHRGIFMQGGIINAGWKGHLTIEFLITGEVEIQKNEPVAHAIIIQSDNKVSYEKSMFKEDSEK